MHGIGCFLSLHTNSDVHTTCVPRISTETSDQNSNSLNQECLLHTRCYDDLITYRASDKLRKPLTMLSRFLPSKHCTYSILKPYPQYHSCPIIQSARQNPHSRTAQDNTVALRNNAVSRPSGDLTIGSLPLKSGQFQFPRFFFSSRLGAVSSHTRMGIYMELKVFFF
jgi:hypothetical protein